MIINFLILFFAILFYSVWGHEGGAPDKDNDKVNSESSMRFANIDLLENDETVVQIFLYQEPGLEGIKINVENRDFIRQNVNPAAKTYVLFNGHPSKDSTEPYERLRGALLQAEPANIFFVYIDWTKHAISFVDAIALADSLGQYISDNLLALQLENPHFIAHCAGAEVASATAKYLYRQNNGPKIPRLTVFDPYLNNRTRLNFAHDFVDFIDVYHAGIYLPTFPPVGTVDFYPNAGIKQPGCEFDDVQKSFLCHHRRSIYLYAESVLQTVNAIEARYDFDLAKLQVLDQPRLTTFGHNLNSAITGSFYLPTFEQEPFLMNYF